MVGGADRVKPAPLSDPLLELDPLLLPLPLLEPDPLLDPELLPLPEPSPAVASALPASPS
jgi:hypothetical protein